MKNLLKKFHRGGSNHSDESESSTSSTKGVGGGHRFSDNSTSEKLSHSKSEHNKPFSAISGWLNSVTNRHNNPSPPSSSNVVRTEPSDSGGSSSLEGALDEARVVDLGSSNSRDQEIEEYQIQLALELSAKEDPEAVQIEAVKQISLGTYPPENTPAEVLAYRYWNYNALSYDDKILDGFYDLYGVVTEPTSSRMPSLVDLQETPVTNDITWEAILVNKKSDPKLLSLEQKVLEMACEHGSSSLNIATSNMVQKLAALVSDHMSGPVIDPENMLVAWRSLHHTLKASHSSMVLPLGSLTIGLARHRALLFKVLADSLGIPCCLVKGQQLTGSDDVAMNFVRIEDGREYIVDLMADPGTLIPADAIGADIVDKDSLFPTVPKDAANISQIASSSTLITTSLDEANERSAFSESNPKDKEPLDKGEHRSTGVRSHHQPMRTQRLSTNEREVYAKPTHHTHARSPSWTEGVSSPAVQRMKVKDVSQYMINAAKENPNLAQKLHDVLLESGVVAPPNLFSETYPDQLRSIPLVETKNVSTPENENNERNKAKGGHYYNNLNQASILPPLPQPRKSMDSPSQPCLNLSKVSETDVSSVVAAAVVASSVVVATSKANTDPKLQLPIATAAAALVATTAAAAVSKQYEAFESSSSPHLVESSHGDKEREGVGGSNSEGERVSDQSTGNESSKSDVPLDDVADCEIPWEDIALGERIGLGSYGEVYHGDWHGTEVAVKKFLDQEVIGQSLEEFKSEVRIMKRLRHPNVVLFMGAVTRPPNLSIVTEFLPRGSLYRLLHRPNNQIDERRRLKMALDAARGMNYLHNCTPVIVHRDLKSPNLLVDKNWVVKVCDFGLSRMKHSTFLSSRSTAGTAEWMAPEVLRNEPSNEKCDVYSFGVILWELCTLQQPWGGMNPMQVVGAVGFQHRRLDIPNNIDPVVADIIRRCWQTDPTLRPSFAEIMAALKPLQKPNAHSQVPKQSRRAEKAQSSMNLEDAER